MTCKSFLTIQWKNSWQFYKKREKMKSRRKISLNSRQKMLRNFVKTRLRDFIVDKRESLIKDHPINHNKSQTASHPPILTRPSVSCHLLMLKNKSTAMNCPAGMKKDRCTVNVKATPFNRSSSSRTVSNFCIIISFICTLNM